MKNIIPVAFFQRDALIVAPELLGKYLIRKTEHGIEKYIINEIEVYRGEEDLACHCSRGRTPRTEVMYQAGGTIYIYLVYGMHFMLNIVTGKVDEPQAILIRGVNGITGPGRLTKSLKIDLSFNNKVLDYEIGLWLEDSDIQASYVTTPRIGIDYAKHWKDKPWRFVIP